jgi:protein-S-isoprenylcysteine O-methyltransferase Ste14
MTSLLVHIGNFFFRYRNRIFPVVMAAGVLLLRPRFPAGSYFWNNVLDVLGLAICVGGQALRVATIGYDYIKRGGKGWQIWAGRLVQGGMFAHSRNPLYLGNVLIFSGLVIVFGSPIACAVGIPTVFFIYICIILAEEGFLRGKFGAEYDVYAARVNRLWPDLRGFSASVKDMTFRWKRVLNKEYGTTFGWVVAAIVLRAWSLYWVQRKAARTEIMATLLLLIPAILAYAWIRRLKKSGQLDEDDFATVDR